MGTLRERLSNYKSQFEKSCPAETIAIMHRATDDLRNSDIMNRVMKVGDTAPMIVLPNAEGKEVSSTELLKKGPLVISFFRGIW